jgi:hypothetical protein
MATQLYICSMGQGTLVFIIQLESLKGFSARQKSIKGRKESLKINTSVIFK